MSGYTSGAEMRDNLCWRSVYFWVRKFSISKIECSSALRPHRLGDVLCLITMQKRRKRRRKNEDKKQRKKFDFKRRNAHTRGRKKNKERNKYQRFLSFGRMKKKSWKIGRPHRWTWEIIKCRYLLWYSHPVYLSMNMRFSLLLLSLHLFVASRTISCPLSILIVTKHQPNS